MCPGRTALVLLLACAVFPALAAPVAEVVGLRGQASQVRDGRSLPLAVGDRVDAGVEIRTRTPGRVKLRFVDGSVIVVSDASSLKVEYFRVDRDMQRRDAGFMLDVGLISQTVTPGRDGGWSVRTPSAVTAVRGTEYLIEVTPDQATQVSVKSGAVEVEPVGGIRLRNIGPGASAIPPSVVLDRRNLGTVCQTNRECEPSKSWSQDRMRALDERLSGV